MKTIVIRPDSKENRVFEFAEADLGATINNERKAENGERKQAD